MINHVSVPRCKKQTVLGTISVSVCHGNPWNNQIRAVCDTGSQLNLITQAAAKRLNLNIEKVIVHLRGAQGTLLERPLGRVKIGIRQSKPTKIIEAVFYVVRRITCPLPTDPVDLNKYGEFSNLPLADPQYGSPGEIDALFGLGIWIKILDNGIVRSSDSLAVAQKSTLGWVIYQTEQETNMELPTRNSVMHITEEFNMHELQQTMQRFWEVENIPSAKILTREERECERIFIESYKRDHNGRYIVSLPFNGKLKNLGKSKSIALRQFFAMERKMTRNERFKEEYIKFMREFENLGHMSQVKDEREDGYYTPHHGVFSSNKFRVVFNASCQTTSGVTLNDCQLVGEKLQKDLCLILINFRCFEVAITADVVKMFRQVEVDDCHKKYQKILWRYSPDEPVRVYQINRVAYGQAAAPFLSVRAMHQCALDYQIQFPLGAQAVLESFYVDDALKSVDTIKQALEIKRQMTNLLEKGCLPLDKWCSNKPIFSRKKEPKFLELKDGETRSVLGLKWIPTEDVFTFQVDEISEQQIWTKRQVLSQIGKLYDPNGYIAPIIITAKIVMQQIWQAVIDWDEQIPQPILNAWIKYLANLPELNSVKIPRWLGLKTTWATDLHCFSDASENAYAAVVYARTLSLDGRVTIRLIQSKTRVSPLKKLTIPRLELCGAYLAAKLTETIQTELNNKIKSCHFWTDSEVVLAWLDKPSSKLKTFVANRVAAIQHKTTDKGFKWRWVSGETNPADLASRGTMPRDLLNNTLWWDGPQWLRNAEENWPRNNPPSSSTDETILAEVKIVALTTIEPLQRGSWYRAKKPSQISMLLKSYSSFTKLKRIMAYILRAISRFKAKSNREQVKNHGSLTSDELEDATIALIRMDQNCSFKKELNEIENASQKDGTIWLDTNNQILRLSGRVLSDNLTFDEQHPILLSPKGDLAPLIIREAHMKTLHGGIQIVLQTIRQRYWIYKGRRLARSILNKCPTCFRYKFKPSMQLMAPLPSTRTMPIRPFKNCGVDYMGPVGLSSKTGRNPTITKAYVCVFVCFTTRAIHLELVSDASTAQFMQAFRRFIARRGPVANILSDNGTNFVGADNQLKEIDQNKNKWNTGTIEQAFNVRWTFITPNAPHHGGLHEAAVKSVKSHLRAVIGAQNLTFEEYATLLAQVEACVNSRPIAPLSDDPNDLCALTPAHFLIGEPLVTLCEPRDLKETRVSYLKRWEMVQQMHQHWWNRWHCEYLANLAQRSKWQTIERDLSANDMVLIREDNLPPSKWSIGRIIETLPGKDGLVRSVRVKTPYGIYQRPITKLGRLPIYN